MPLKLSLLEIIIRGIPECFLFVFAAYTFSKTAINSKRYLLSSLLFGVIAYGVRLLPIQYGVHTIINLIFLIVIMTAINKIEIIKSIRAGIISIILEFICEGINVFILKNVLKEDLNLVLGDPTLKTLYGLPSLAIFGCIVAILYIIFYKRKELKQINYGKAD
jgi:hypothetical protein